MGDVKCEKGDGRWEMADGRQKMGDGGRKSTLKCRYSQRLYVDTVVELIGSPSNFTLLGIVIIRATSVVETYFFQQQR